MKKDVRSFYTNSSSKPKWTIRYLFLISILGWVLASCNPFRDQGQSQVDATEKVLASNRTFGQTFTSNQAGLYSIETYLSSDQPGQGVILFHLRSSPQSTLDITTSSIDAATIKLPGYYAFTFQPQPGSYRNNYYFYLEMKGNAKIRIGSAAGNTYLDGSLYQNGQPVDAQLTFRPVYGMRLLSIGLLNQGITWFGQTVIAFLLFIVPGWGLLSWFWNGWENLQWMVKLGLSAGVSLALYPVLLLWFDLIHLHLGAGYALLPLTAGIIIIIIRNHTFATDFKQFFKTKSLFPKHTNIPRLAPHLTFVVVMALVVAVRFWAIRTIDIPLWGDSYQHTIIAQLIIDHNGLFTSWQPYVPYNSLSVQYGFSADSAVFAWLSGLAAPQATLLTAQMINALSIVTLLPLALRLSRGMRWAGVATALVGGLLSPMPMFYVNWGRFAQLAGQAILPASLWFTWDYQDSQDRFDWKKMIIIGTTIAGMLLTYYRMVFYFATFLFAWLLGWGLLNWVKKPKGWLSGIIKFLEIAGISFLFTLPWAFKVSGSKLASDVGTGISQGTQLMYVLQDYSIWKTIFYYLPASLLILSVLAMVWGLLRRDWMIPAMALWVIALSSITAASLIKLPGANLMQSFAVLIALYIPASLLSGWLYGQIFAIKPFTQGNISSVFNIVSAIIIITIAVFGFNLQQNSSDPREFSMVNAPDLRAMQWIQDNTPATSRFLVEGFSIYNGASVVGSDAGWWISLLGKRQNTMPPQYALLNEISTPPDYSKRVTNLVKLLETQPVTLPDSITQLCKEGISHVYIGQRQGEVGGSGHPLFSPESLLESASFDVDYHQDRVWIFSLKPEICRNY